MSGIVLGIGWHVGILLVIPSHCIAAWTCVVCASGKLSRVHRELRQVSVVFVNLQLKFQESAPDHRPIHDALCAMQTAIFRYEGMLVFNRAEHVSVLYSIEWNTCSYALPCYAPSFSSSVEFDR